MHMGVELGKEVGGISLRRDDSSQCTAGADMIDVVMVPDVHIHTLLLVGYFEHTPIHSHAAGTGML